MAALHINSFKHWSNGEIYKFNNVTPQNTVNMSGNEDLIDQSAVERVCYGTKDTVH